jgi:hypothetical protein
MSWKPRSWKNGAEGRYEAVCSAARPLIAKQPERGAWRGHQVDGRDPRHPLTPTPPNPPGRTLSAPSRGRRQGFERDAGNRETGSGNRGAGG